MNQQPLVHHPFEACYDSIMDDSHLGYRIILIYNQNSFFHLHVDKATHDFIKYFRSQQKDQPS